MFPVIPRVVLLAGAAYGSRLLRQDFHRHTLGGDEQG